ncbi:hypothetical protein CBM2634_B140101 [Cupriavidus taiwanensis]|uniref:Uncharacterized protein n=1 Tax=Cupriavidus taiwanensis TaxID=164546 RepID=A0A375J5I6_9BURK|nr:hypothetical protein CBM2634_B140101 [Cupriavidus taiwanensis]
MGCIVVSIIFLLALASFTGRESTKAFFALLQYYAAGLADTRPLRNVFFLEVSERLGAQQDRVAQAW